MTGWNLNIFCQFSRNKIQQEGYVVINATYREGMPTADWLNADPLLREESVCTKF